MELRVLRYFVTVAREENITKAANILHMTQPTLSRQLKELEEELGVTLFVRKSHQTLLTPEGHILYQHAVDILNMVEKTQNEFEAMKKFEGGNIYVGLAESQHIALLAKTATSIKQQYPKFTLNMTTGNIFTVKEQLENGLLDFAVVVDQNDDTTCNYLPFPRKDRWGLLMRQDCSLSSKEMITLEDLYDVPLIVSGQNTNHTLMTWNIKNKKKLNIVGYYDLINNASLLVKEGFGCALAFENLVHIDHTDLLFRPIEPFITSQMFVIWKKNRQLSRSADIFLQELKKTFVANKKALQ